MKADRNTPPVLAVVGMYHETNTFAPGFTSLSDFDGERVSGNPAFLERYTGTRTSMGGIIDAAAAAGAVLQCGTYLSAIPSGLVNGRSAEAILELLTEAVDEKADGVIVILHGAMAGEGFPDMDGELLRRIRRRLGDGVPVAATLDLHANISREMVDNASLLVGYDTYPHIDAYERAVEAVQLLVGMLRGEVRPVMELAKPGMLVVPQAMRTDSDGPMKELVDRAHQMERLPGVLSITVAGGFPYSDVADAGFSFAVTTDGDRALARKLAEELREMAWRRREELRDTGFASGEAVAMAMDAPSSPVILVEGADNVGGGAPGDATHLLPYLETAPKRSLMMICDPEAAARAHALGEGAPFDAFVGGRSGPLQGEPRRIRGTVKRLSDGVFTHCGAYMTGQLADMGRTAVVEAGPVTLIVTSKRMPPWDPGHYLSLGLRAEDYQAIVVKAAVAWITAYGHAAKAVISVDSPGCCSSNLSRLPYQGVKRPVYPLD